MEAAQKWDTRWADIFPPFLDALFCVHTFHIAGIFASLKMRWAGEKAIDYYSIGRCLRKPALTSLFAHVKAGSTN